MKIGEAHHGANKRKVRPANRDLRLEGLLSKNTAEGILPSTSLDCPKDTGAEAMG